MNTNSKIGMLLLGVILSGLISSSASSRNWKQTPTQAAGDYAFIADSKSNNDYVQIRWWASPTVAPGTPVAGILEKYIVISVVHYHLNQPGGNMSLYDVNTLEARNADGKSLHPVSRDALQPAAAGVLTTFETAVRQQMGRIGDGTKFFTFDADNVRACEKGGISVPFAGETYTWETPFPGCSPQAPKTGTQVQNPTQSVEPRPKTQAPATASDSKNDLVPVKIGTGIIWKKGKGAQVAPLKIEADAGNYAVKLLDSKSNGGVLMIYVGANQTFETKIPLGTYRIFGATGNVWYGNERLFGPATTYFVLRRFKNINTLYMTSDTPSMTRDDEFRFWLDEKKGSRTYMGHTIQLQKRSDGNMSTDPITPSEFNQ
jgi:hypothetical protein